MIEWDKNGMEKEGKVVLLSHGSVGPVLLELESRRAGIILYFAKIKKGSTKTELVRVSALRRKAQFGASRRGKKVLI